MYVCFHRHMYAYMNIFIHSHVSLCIDVFVWVGIDWEVKSQCDTDVTAFFSPHTNKSSSPSHITALGVFHTFWIVWVIWHLSCFLPNHNFSSCAQLSPVKEVARALEGCALCSLCFRSSFCSLETNKWTGKWAAGHRAGQGFISPSTLRNI